jgi:hypothetical protein
MVAPRCSCASSPRCGATTRHINVRRTNWQSFRGARQPIGQTKRGMNTKLHGVSDADGRPLSVFMTPDRSATTQRGSDFFVRKTVNVGSAGAPRRRCSVSADRAGACRPLAYATALNRFAMEPSARSSQLHRHNRTMVRIGVIIFSTSRIKTTFDLPKHRFIINRESVTHVC